MAGFENPTNANERSCSESGRESLSLEAFGGNFVEDSLPRFNSDSLLKEQVNRCNTEQPIMDAFLLEASDRDAFGNTDSTMRALRLGLGEDFSYVAMLNEDGSSRVKLLNKSDTAGSSIVYETTRPISSTGVEDITSSSLESCKTQVDREDYEWIELTDFGYDLAYQGLTVGEAKDTLKKLETLKQNRDERESKFYVDLMGLDPNISLDDARSKFNRDFLASGMKEILGLPPEADSKSVEKEFRKWMMPNSSVFYDGSPAAQALAWRSEMNDRALAAASGLDEGTTYEETKSYRRDEERAILGRFSYSWDDDLKFDLKSSMFVDDLKYEIKTWVPCEVAQDV